MRQSLSRELEGCSAAYYLVHSMLAAGAEYAKKDLDLAHSFAEASKQAGIKRIIYLGGLGETGQDLSEHLASRREVEKALGSTGIPVTVLRAAMIIGSGSASFEILRYLVNRLPVMITPRWVKTRCQPIAIENVLTYLVEVLNNTSTIGEVFDIGGSEILPYRDIMRIMAEELGLPARIIIPVPVLTPRLSSYWIHFVTPLSYKIARPLAEGLKNPVVCRDDRIAKLIPQRLLNVRESIHAALTQVEAMEVETNWSMAGPIPGDPDWAGGKVFRDAREMVIDAPDSSVYDAVCRIGGNNGWSMSWLWRIRGWLDHLAGGPGLRRGRRDPIGCASATLWIFGESLPFRAIVTCPCELRCDCLERPSWTSGSNLRRRAKADFTKPPSFNLADYLACCIGGPSFPFIISCFARCLRASSTMPSTSPGKLLRFPLTVALTLSLPWPSRAARWIFIPGLPLPGAIRRALSAQRWQFWWACVPSIGGDT